MPLQLQDILQVIELQKGQMILIVKQFYSLHKQIILILVLLLNHYSLNNIWLKSWKKTLNTVFLLVL